MLLRFRILGLNIAKTSFCLIFMGLTQIFIDEIDQSCSFEREYSSKWAFCYSKLLSHIRKVDSNFSFFLKCFVNVRKGPSLYSLFYLARLRFAVLYIYKKNFISSF